jgi:hypothetical protein
MVGDLNRSTQHLRQSSLLGFRPPVRGQLVTKTDDEGPPNARPIDFSALAGFQRSHN